MQSEYPLSVFIVVPPWPGPVEQNPEPTTPTGPPRPAAAAAATLSRYQGYIEWPAEYHRAPSMRIFSLPNLARTVEFQANIHSLGHTSRLCRLPFPRFFPSSVYFSAIRTRHAARDIHLTADDITATCCNRGIVARYTPRSRTTTTADAAPRSSRAKTLRESARRPSAKYNITDIRVRTSQDRALPRYRLARAASGSRVPRVPHPIRRPRGTVIERRRSCCSLPVQA